MSFGRLLARFIVVPIAVVLAVAGAAVVAFVANWNRFVSMLGADPSGSDGSLIVGLALVFVASVPIVAMLIPACIGVLISEAFSIRSWIFHALNGALSVWVGRAAFGTLERPFEFYDSPLVALAAGLAAGFVYWAVAGWNAGVMKPVRALPPAAQTPR
jgi:hypothetical protein